jgi:hypothetical protein
MGENEEKKILIQNIVDCIGSMNNIDINRNLLKNDLINGKKFKENEIENLLNEVFNGKETIQKQDALNKLSSLFQSGNISNNENINLVKPTNNLNLPKIDFKIKEHKNLDLKKNDNNEIRKVQSVKNEQFSNKLLDKIKDFKNELLSNDNNNNIKRNETNNFRERIEKLNKNDNNIIKKNKNQIQKNDVNDIKGKINSLKKRTIDNKKDPFEDINNMLNNFKNKK